MAHPLPDLADIPVNLAVAMVVSSHTPLMLLDGDQTVIAASGSFCTAFGIDPAGIAGQPLSAIGNGEWGRPQLHALLAATAAQHAEIDAYEMDLERPGQPSRKLILNAHRLDYGDATRTRMVLAVVDVTDARKAAKATDDLAREKAILLQELQHRVANSLQIIASVIMQSARNVQSDETRAHLRDAHNRVMSVGVLQRQLSQSSLSDVALRPYLTDLCRSIGASMIHDPEQLSLTVTVDDSSTDPDTSISLGLIVTELVINALKHAFPGFRSGKISVEYHAKGDNWTLIVSDDGVGMKWGEDAPTSGLGTGIVDALAKQLQANVTAADGNPGTTITIAR